MRTPLFAASSSAMAPPPSPMACCLQWPTGALELAEARALEGRVAALAGAIPANPFRSADAAALGVAPGPRMGRVLRAATEAWLEAGLPEDADRRDALLREAVAACP